MLVHFVFGAAGNLSGLASGAAGVVEKIVGSLLIAGLAVKTMAYVLGDRPGAAVGCIVAGVIVAIFAFDPGGATSLLTGAAKEIGG